MTRLAILVSGSGTIFEAMINGGLLVDLVIADRPCRALDIARAAGIPTALINRLDFGFRPRTAWDRGGFTAAFEKELLEHHIGLVAMSGFMTVFAPAIFDRFHDRILNTHPALLPAFKGAHAVADALAAGVEETGFTVHIATPLLDDGRIIAQEHVPVMPGDTLDILWERIKVAERVTYPRVIQEYARTLKPT